MRASVDFTLIAILLIVASTSLALAREPADGELTPEAQAAVAAIRALKGEIEFDEIAPGQWATSVELGYVTKRNGGLEHLAALPHLRTLKLSCYARRRQLVRDPQTGWRDAFAYGNDSLEHVAKLPELSDLTLGGDAFDAHGMHHLTGMTQLQRLTFLGGGGLTVTRVTNGEDVTILGLAELADLPKLRFVQLSYASVYNIRALKSLKALRELLILSGNNRLPDELFELVQLEGLIVYFATFADADLRRIPELVNLQKLQITGHHDDRIVQSKPGRSEPYPVFATPRDSGRKAFEQFSKMDGASRERYASLLRQLFGLGIFTKVTVLDRQVSRKDLEPDSLAVLFNLMNATVRFSKMKVTNKSLERIGQLKKLKDLTLEGARVNDEGLIYLQGLPDLESITLDNTSVTPEGMSRWRAARKRAGLPAVRRMTPRFSLGVELQLVDASQTNVFKRVVTGSPAAQAGLQLDDRIVQLDGKAIANGDELLDHLSELDHATVEIVIERGGENISLQIQLATSAEIGRLDWEERLRQFEAKQD